MIFSDLSDKEKIEFEKLCDIQFNIKYKAYVFETKEPLYFTEKALRIDTQPIIDTLFFSSKN